jgi:dienelactone hydrolase
MPGLNARLRPLLGLVIAAPCLVQAGTLRAGGLTEPPGLSRTIISVPIAPNGASVVLEALLTRPAAPGRYPLVVLSHGAPRDGADRPTMAPTHYSAVAIEFARRGWAVIAPMRRGYGRSAGPYAESDGTCKSPDYPTSGRAASADLIETIKYMAHQDYVDPGRVLLVGHSAGGFASIAAAARRPPGVLAVLNFAGGRGSDAPDSVCREDLLVDSYAGYGSSIRIPTLWLYAENDHFFGPKLARRFFAAFTGAGGIGTFVALPSFGADGHQLFNADGMPLWRDPVDAFLRQHNLPTWTKPISERAENLPAPSQLSASGRRSFASYLNSANFEKAFAVSAKGGYGWASGHRSADEASHTALEICLKDAPNCKLYAVNGRLAH